MLRTSVILLVVLAFVAGETISSHVLDISSGQPAENFNILSYYNDNDVWVKLGNFCTGPKGRVDSVIGDYPLKIGIYKLAFDTAHYYKQQNLTTFYPNIEIIFEITDNTVHHHVPITLSPYGYSTYKGSA